MFDKSRCNICNKVQLGRLYLERLFI